MAYSNIRFPNSAQIGNLSGQVVSRPENNWAAADEIIPIANGYVGVLGNRLSQSGVSVPASGTYYVGTLPLSASFASIISSPITLYLAPSGSDNVTFSQAQNPSTPLFSPMGAMRLLSNYSVTSAVTITLSAMPGVYTFSETQYLFHPAGEKMNLIGTTTAASVMDMTSANSTTFMVSDATFDCIRIQQSQFNNIDNILLEGSVSGVNNTRNGLYILLGGGLGSAGPMLASQHWNYGIILNTNSFVNYSTGLAVRNNTYGLACQSNSYFNGLNLYCLDNSTGMYTINSSFSTFQNSVVTGNSSYGIYTNFSSCVSFSGAVVIGNGTGVFSDQGSRAYAPASTLVVSGNTTNWNLFDMGPLDNNGNYYVYVRPNGSDTSDALYATVNDDAHAFATPIGAINNLTRYKISNVTSMNIIMAQGTYDLGDSTINTYHSDGNYISISGYSSAASASAMTSANSTFIKTTSNAVNINVGKNFNSINGVYLSGDGTDYGIYANEFSSIYNVGPLVRIDNFDRGFYAIAQSKIRSTGVAIYNCNYGIMAGNGSVINAANIYLDGVAAANNTAGVYSAHNSFIAASPLVVKNYPTAILSDFNSEVYSIPATCVTNITSKAVSVGHGSLAYLSGSTVSGGTNSLYANYGGYISFILSNAAGGAPSPTSGVVGNNNSYISTG